MTPRRLKVPRQFVLSSLLLFAFLGPASPAQSQAWPFDQPFMPQRGRLGIQVQPMTPELREYFKAPSDRGLLVTHIDANSPAARAGLRVGDVIVLASGQPMRRPFDLVRVVGRVSAGGSLELKIIRDAREQTLTVEPEGKPTPWMDPEYWSEWFGRSLRPGTESLRRRLDDLERRLEELERKFEQLRQPNERHST
jgi:membrane-associated protease RseP (regulator of RpoE activity)